nr:type I-C CRISPR-associated protein Cas8c/Csd1 [Moraxella osloensis]
MILQALTQYYQRKADNGSDIAPQGFEYKQIPFIIVIDKDGNFVQLEDTRGADSKTKKGNFFLAPLASTRSGKNSADVANLLWDHYGYIFAHPKEDTDTAIVMANRQHQAFKQRINEVLTKTNDSGLKAVKEFLTNQTNIDLVKNTDTWQQCLKIKGCNLTFRLQGETDLICQSKAIQSYIANQSNYAEDESNESSEKGICLITGNKDTIARLHQPIGGVNAKPAPFASINLDAFESYNKSQGYGFPVSEKGMFEYTTALNTLLKSDNRFRIGETVAVCFSEKQSEFEDELALLFGDNVKKDNPDEFVNTVKNLFSSIHNGAYTKDDGTQKMYVLGLSPNVARIVVRFWYESTVADMAVNIAQWFDDIRMVKGANSPYPEYMPLLRLLCNLVFEGKSENLPPNLVADTTKAILNGGILPITLLQMAIRRNRAEQSVTYARASLIKAYLNRKIRFNCSKNTTKNKEITVSYDPNRQDIGYVLGALFATLEKVQEDSSESKINATIKDRYYGSASSTPLTVFATLIKLSQHHLSKISKIKPNRAVYFNRELGEIMNKIDKFPSHLNMEQQGLFAIGYYQKRQDFFVKKEDRQPQDADAKTNEI